MSKQYTVFKDKRVKNFFRVKCYKQSCMLEFVLNPIKFLHIWINILPCSSQVTLNLYITSH